MDLDQLKSVWKKANDQEKAGYWVSEENIRAMIQENSRATIADVARQVKWKIKKSGWIGAMAFALGLYVLITAPYEPDFFMNMEGWQYGGMMLLMASTLLLIHFHSRWRLRQIRKVEESSGSLKEAVLKTDWLFQRVIKTGIWSDTIVTPAVILFVVGVSFYEDQPFAFDNRFLIMLGIAIGGALIFYRLGHFMLHRKFGRFLNLLKQRKQELEELESET